MRLTYALVVACGLLPALSAQPPAQPVTTPAAVGFPPPLYRMSDIGKSLNLTPEQVTNLNKLTDATQARFRDEYAKLGILPEAARAAQMQELNRRYTADWNKAAQGCSTTPSGPSTSSSATSTAG